jgi:hypothetical protein
MSKIYIQCSGNTEVEITVDISLSQTQTRVFVVGSTRIGEDYKIMTATADTPVLDDLLVYYKYDTGSCIGLPCYPDEFTQSTGYVTIPAGQTTGSKEVLFSRERCILSDDPFF